MRYESARKSQKRKYPLRLACIALLLATAVSGCIYRTAVSHQPKIVGIVTAAAGTPSIVRHNEHLLIGVQSLIYQGDIIETDSGSRTRIRMIDHSIIHVGGDCHVVIHRYDYDPKDRTSRVLLTFTSGAMRFSPEDQSAMPTADIHIETPVANVHVRSQSFWAGFNANSTRLDILLLKGKSIEVTNDQGGVKVETAGFGTSVLAGGTPQIPMQWPAQKRASVINATTI